ncbi:51_t:CDS:2 [Diversispora eburnea]|uniref:51_t:CDS:1 n=1 Tax=Diversispora eburnea TaxID=1213867 RepID=A0A9N9BR76_9GLOM|nr:51_t:CDS:2 [Diversispora eburnea]
MYNNHNNFLSLILDGKQQHYFNDSEIVERGELGKGELGRVVEKVNKLEREREVEGKVEREGIERGMEKEIERRMERGMEREIERGIERDTLDWIKKDGYYCLLIPITLPVAVYSIFWNWLGMKFFKHN